jgi:hypothetical protein
MCITYSVNSRAHMKMWPLLVVCQATGAIHVELLHSYGTKHKKKIKDKKPRTSLGVGSRTSSQ